MLKPVWTKWIFNHFVSFFSYYQTDDIDALLSHTGALHHLSHYKKVHLDSWLQENYFLERFYLHLPFFKEKKHLKISFLSFTDFRYNNEQSVNQFNN